MDAGQEPPWRDPRRVCVVVAQLGIKYQYLCERETDVKAGTLSFYRQNSTFHTKVIALQELALP